jgi:hypothetical protein
MGARTAGQHRVSGEPGERSVDAPEHAHILRVRSDLHDIMHATFDFRELGLSIEVRPCAVTRLLSVSTIGRTPKHGCAWQPEDSVVSGPILTAVLMKEPGYLRRAAHPSSRFNDDRRSARAAVCYAARGLAPAWTAFLGFRMAPSGITPASK